MVSRKDVVNILNLVKIGDYSVNDSSNLIDDGLLDSFSILMFVIEIKQKYDVTVSIESDVHKIFRTADSLYIHVKNEMEEIRNEN
jgi:acyl carrier protein